MTARMAGTEVTTLGDLLLGAAARWPEQDLLVFRDERSNYAQLGERASVIARALIARGVNPGDHVGIYAHNAREVIEHLFAISLCGGVAVLLNARYQVEELRFAIANADLVMLFTGASAGAAEDLPERLARAYPALCDTSDPRALALDQAPALQRVVCWNGAELAGAERYTTFLEAASGVPQEQLEARRQAIAVRDPVIMMYTSGTTSRPKGCLLCHEAVVRSAMGMAERLDIRGNDRLWDPLPLFHMAAILPLLAIILRGGCYLTDAHFDAGDSLDQITRERATMLYPAFPTIMADLVSHADFDPASLGSVRLINNVAPADQLRQNMRLLPDAIHISAYGLTEAGGISCHGDAAESDEVRATTCGRPYAGVRMRVVDPDTGETLPPTERGEMRIRGFSLFSGYYKASDATRAAFDDDGWLRTGDLCSFTEAGQVVYHGRLKDLLKIGGENVSPLELESYLGSLDGVVLAQVVGVPDARLQEVAAAFVQLRPGCELSEADIMEQCRGNIASFKVPRHVRFVDAWPMSATKIQKHVLRSKLLEELGLVD